MDRKGVSVMFLSVFLISLKRGAKYRPGESFLQQQAKWFDAKETLHGTFKTHECIAGMLIGKLAFEDP